MTKESALRYDLTIRTIDGLYVDLLRDERSRPASQYFILFSDVPSLRRRMAVLGAAVIDREVLAVLVRDGLVRQWN